MRVLESFWYAGARDNLAVCGCSNHFGMRVLESFWYTGARVTLVCGCSRYFDERVLKSFCCALKHHILEYVCVHLIL